MPFVPDTQSQPVQKTGFIPDSDGFAPDAQPTETGFIPDSQPVITDGQTTPIDINIPKETPYQKIGSFIKDNFTKSPLEAITPSQEIQPLPYREPEIRQAPSPLANILAQVQRKAALVGQGLYGDIPFVRGIIPEEARRVEPVTKGEESLRDAAKLAQTFAMLEATGAVMPGVQGAKLLPRMAQAAGQGALYGTATSGTEDIREMAMPALSTAAVFSMFPLAEVAAGKTIGAVSKGIKNFKKSPELATIKYHLAKLFRMKIPTDVILKSEADLVRKALQGEQRSIAKLSKQFGTKGILQEKIDISKKTDVPIDTTVKPLKKYIEVPPQPIDIPAPKPADIIAPKPVQPYTGVERRGTGADTGMRRRKSDLELKVEQLEKDIYDEPTVQQPTSEPTVTGEGGQPTTAKPQEVKNEDELKKSVSTLYNEIKTKFKQYLPENISEDVITKNTDGLMKALVTNDFKALARFMHKDNKSFNKIFTDLTGLKIGKDVTRQQLADTPSNVSLIQDILNKKKTAKPQTLDEYIASKGKPLYHGTSAKFDKFDIDKYETIKKGDWGKGIYLESSKSGAEYYRDEAVGKMDKEANDAWKKLESLKQSDPKWNEARQAWLKALEKAREDTSNGAIVEAYISPDAKILRKNTQDGITDSFLAEDAKKRGYDVLLIDEGRFTEEYVVINPDVLKTKAQLTEEWKSMQQPSAKDMTLDEYIASKGGIVYHGTNKKFEEFDESKINTVEPRTDFAGSGFSFTNDKMKAKKYAGQAIKKSGGQEQIMEVVLDMKNPLIIRNGKDAQALRDSFGGDKSYFSLSPQDIQKELIKRGYDSVDDRDYGQKIVFSKSQIKTKAQLTEEWNKAKGEKKPVKKPKKQPLASAEEPTARPQERKKPLMTEGQIKRMAKKKLIKKKALQIESVGKIKEAVTQHIRQRSYQANLNNYETNLYVEELKQSVPSLNQRKVIPFIIERTTVPEKLGKELVDTYKKHAKDLIPIVNQIREHFKRGYEYMLNNIDNMTASEIENYVTHIWKVPKDKKSMVTNWFITKNKFLKQRHVDTLKQGIEELGLEPRELDIAEIIRTHDLIMHKTIENAKFVKWLKGLRVRDPEVKGGIPLIMRSDKAPAHWSYIDHPALRETMIMPGEAKMGEKVSPELQNILTEMGIAIGRRISPVAFGKPTKTAGLAYTHREPPEIRLQRFFKTSTVAHEIGHHLDVKLNLGDKFVKKFKNEIYALNRDRLERFKGKTGKFGQAYAESTEELIAELFAHIFADSKKAFKLAPNASRYALELLKKDGVLTKLVDFDFENKAKNLIEEQMNTRLQLGVKVHPDLVTPLNVIFEARDNSELIRGYEMVNGFLKKAQLSLSLFHHVALTETSIATVGLGKTASILLNPARIYRAMVKGEYDVFKKTNLARDAVKHGVVFGATADIPVQKIQKMFNELAEKTKNTPLVNLGTKFIATFNEKWDKALWTYLHDNLKLYAYEHLANKLKVYDKSGKEEIAQFINDTFGGQNWEALMVSPKMLQVAGWGLLSPDWTLSTLRQALAPTGVGTVHEETKRLRMKLGYMFWAKAAFYFGAGMNMINAVMREYDKQKNPEYYKTWDNKFMDSTMFGNTLGHKTHLFMGRFDDGTERYVRWGKQFRELPEFIFDDGVFSPVSATLKKLGGKTAPNVQNLFTVFAGVAPSGFTDRDIYNKRGWERTWGIAKKLFASPLPFSSHTMFQDGKEFNLLDLAMPSSKGMSRYKAVEYFKTAIAKKDERMLKETWQGAYTNGLPGNELFNAAMTSLRAEGTKDRNSKLKTIKDLKSALATEQDPRARKSIANRIKRLMKEQVDIMHGWKYYDRIKKKMELE